VPGNNAGAEYLNAAEVEVMHQELMADIGQQSIWLRAHTETIS
jgi:hypothetical protein